MRIAELNNMKEQIIIWMNESDSESQKKEYKKAISGINALIQALEKEK